MTADIFSNQYTIVGGASMQSRRMGDTVQMMGEEKIERRPIAAVVGEPRAAEAVERWLDDDIGRSKRLNHNSCATTTLSTTRYGRLGWLSSLYICEYERKSTSRGL